MGTRDSWRAIRTSSGERRRVGVEEAAEIEAIEVNRKAEVPHAIAEALSEAHVGLAIIDGRSESIVFANQALLAITGRSPGQTIGSEFVELVEPMDADRVRLRLREAAFGASTDAPLSVRMRDAGERTTIGDLSFRACTQGGKRTVVAVVTVARAREAGALRQALDHALEALRQRDDFFALAAHELQTPLTSVLLNVQSAAALTRRDPSRVGPALASAEAQVKRVSVLVEQLLDVARMRAGRLVLDYETSDLRAVLLEVCGRFSEACIRSGSTLEIACPEPVIGRWDAFRLEQVMTNLLSNALKYSPGQPIRIALRSDERRATLTVGDRGRGISSADLARVFERFERAHDGPVRGTGLGLWIARQLVEAHGGTIEVASEPGHGATFVVDLPLT